MLIKNPAKYLLCFINITIINFSLNAQTLVTNNSTHEKWEFVLEDTGDILQIALPAIAGLTTIIKKDWEGTKQFALSYGTGFIVTHSLKKIVKKERPEG